MNRHTTRLLGIVVALGALLLAGVTVASAANGSAGTFFGRMMGAFGQGGPYGPGPGAMIGGSGPQNGTGYGPGGMMGGYGPGGAGRGYGPGGMMGGWNQSATSGKTISINQAKRDVQRYIDQLGNKNLVIDEVMEFQRNFYAVINDTSSGRGAMEVLVNKTTGAVFPEYGPARMWNTQYGMMTGGWGGMMGYQQPAGPMTVSTDQARQIAQRWLANNRPGATIEMLHQFPGYYTIHFEQNGRPAGMFSINGYSGQVWYHNWHGKFVRALEVNG